MRQRPDVIVIGEIRDEESANAALSVSESGHLVLCSIHANTTIGALHKLAYLCRSEVDRDGVIDVLGRTVLGVTNQIMLPKIGGGRVPAFEMLFNHKGQVAQALGDKGRLLHHMKTRADDMSCTMSSFLKELVG